MRARRSTRNVATLLMVIGALVGVAGVAIDPVTGWSSWLTAALFGVHLALAALVFAGIHLAVGATWWRRVRPSIVWLTGLGTVPAVVLIIVLAAATTVLYPWAHPGAMEQSHLLHGKAAWLNVPLFLARAGVVLVIWGLFARAFRRRIYEEDPPPRGLGAGFLVAFAATISVASWDWTMSLEPEWFSTMHAVYNFAGIFLGGIAALVVISHYADVLGIKGVVYDDKARHDLGKLLFAFAFFWAYIWFCQYMLVWYANLPEEAIHYFNRTQNGWSLAFWINPVLNGILPFVLLISAARKKSPEWLLQVAVLVLIGRWLDTYLMVAPPILDAPAVPTTAMLTSASVLLFALWWNLRSHRTSADGHPVVASDLGVFLD